MKTKLLPLLLISALWAALGTGCNTTKGVGKDIEKAGNKLQDAAKESEWLGALLVNSLMELEQKLTNELPALIEGLDAPQIRIRTKKIYDQFKEKLAPMGKRFATK